MKFSGSSISNLKSTILCALCGSNIPSPHNQLRSMSKMPDPQTTINSVAIASAWPGLARQAGRGNDRWRWVRSGIQAGPGTRSPRTRPGKWRTQRQPKPARPAQQWHLTPRHTCNGEAPSTEAAWRRELGWIQRWLQAAHHKRKRYQGMRQRNQQGEARRSSGGRLKTRIKPRPSVTADAPNGNIRTGSNRRLSAAG